jgi:hypothetical protein
MSDQTPPTPDADPTAALPPVAPEIPAAELPAPQAPAAEAPAAEAAAPAQWPAQGYPPPPAYPPAATYPAQEAPAAPPTYPPAANPAAYPPPGYPAAPTAPQTSSNAIIALILAIVSWAVCPIIPAVVALVLASSAAKEIEASGGRVQGAGLVTAARIVSWVNIGLWAAMLVVGAFFLVLAIVAGGMNDVKF